MTLFEIRFTINFLFRSTQIKKFGTLFVSTFIDKICFIFYFMSRADVKNPIYVLVAQMSKLTFKKPGANPLEEILSLKR